MKFEISSFPDLPGHKSDRYPRQVAVCPASVRPCKCIVTPANKLMMDCSAAETSSDLRDSDALRKADGVKFQVDSCYFHVVLMFFPSFIFLHFYYNS